MEKKCIQNNVFKGYILNEDQVYGNGNMKEIKNKSVCEPKIMYWNTSFPKCFNNKNNSVCQNINYGGLVCNFKPRSNINTNTASRIFENVNVPDSSPCKLVQRVKTEFYLQHGRSSSCSVPHWMKR